MKRFLSTVPRPSSAGWMWIAAIGSAALAVYAGQRYLGAREHELREAARAGLAGRSVIVAAHDLQSGTVIGATDLALREVPERYLPSGSVASEAAGSLVGRRVRVPRRGGEVLQLADIESASDRALSMRVAAGQRAVTLAVDELGALSGLLRPGDDVDLYYMPNGSETEARIGLLLSRVPVLATGARSTGPTGSAATSLEAGSFSAITVQVSPEDAERLSLAQRSGQVLPVLRRPGDETTPTAGIRSARSLLARTRPALVAARGAEPEHISLEVIVGGRGNAVVVEQTGGR